MPSLSAELERTTIAAGELLPGYEILSVIGSGGFGTVLQARQLKLDRIVAVKVIELDKMANPALAARFQSEAITLGKFHHPNIVQVHDFVIHSGRMFIAMELLEGEDLGQRLKRAGQLDERLAWAIARQTASALAHAAAQSVVHRDIKPTNLFLIPAPTGIGLPRDVPMVKVTDFGLALTKWAVDASANRLTAQGAVLGTPVYMAPEQYRGEQGLDHRADIYALGATVFHCLAGRPPFDGDTVWDVMVQKLESEPRAWPSVSAESITLLRAMLASNPEQRIGSYEELTERIQKLPAFREPAAQVAADQTKTAVLARPVKTRGIRSRRKVAIAVISALAAIAGIAMHVGWPNPEKTLPDKPAVRYVRLGNQQALFDNHSLDGWLPPAAGGAWRVELDDDKTTVMCGTGFTRHAFPVADNYRVIVGLDLHKANVAEVHFGVRQDSADAVRRFVLRVSRSEGAMFGAKDGDTAAFQPLRPAIPFPGADRFAEGSTYLELRFEHTGNGWSGWFNGQEIGRALDDGFPKINELRLFADGRGARVDSVIFERLQIAAPR